ncbi:MAG: EVE domain-containing protein [Acidobacteriota bacterium]
MTKYWIGVASKNHVINGVKDGAAMLNHGKLAPLKKMSAGDFLIYYAPKIELGKDEICQKFVAVGKIKTGEPYQIKLSEDFDPYRVDVEYFKCENAEIRPLIGDLEFIKNKKSWGYVFRFGHIEISEKDFNLISAAMKAKIKK